MRILILILLLSSSAWAANKYVRQGAAGTGSGNDWTNAYTDLPSSLTRGDTYYVADGSYSGYTFDDANSSTTRITIKKATASDHGTETGWSSAYGDGIATWGSLVFGGSSSNTGGYYTFDGAYGGGPDNWEGPFGFVVSPDISMPQFVDRNADQIIIQHVEIDVGETGPSDVRGLILYASDGFTLRYAYLHDSGCDLISANVMNDFTIEYSKLARNRQAEPGCHGDLIEYQIGDASNFVIRYNFFEDIVGSYAFGSHDPTITGYYIYGNIFYWTFNPFFGNHLVGCLSGGGTLNNVKFFNNSLNGNFSGSNIGFGTLRGSGNEVRNNIYRQSTGSGFGFSFSDTTNSSNTFYNGSGGAQENLTGNPFVSVPSDFSLAANSTSGTDVGSPYNVDMFGNTRTTWTRGAIEFQTGGSGSATIQTLNVQNLNITGP